MTYRGILSAIYVISVVPLLSVGQTGICVNIHTGQSECCSDYKNVFGTCIACVGSWGKDCVYDCEFGFYGHGCREKCNCGQNQTCDVIRGCVMIADSTIASPWECIERTWNRLSAENGINVCRNNQTGLSECCENFANITGICEPCIGFTGENCSIPCSSGFYGFGCRGTCNCSKEEMCDKKLGCVYKTAVTVPEIKTASLTDTFTTTILYEVLDLHDMLFLADGLNVCYNKNSGTTECCENFANITGVCEPCIGSWGDFCQYPCTGGYFGLGCRKTCNCSLQETCDRKLGCILKTVVQYLTLPCCETGSREPCDKNRETGERKCCTDYRNVSGRCEACVGSWGTDCKQTCGFGFYGHGCRKKCNCNQNQTCDVIRGCVEISNTEQSQTPKQNEDDDMLQVIIIGVGGAFLLSLIGTVLFVHLKQKNIFVRTQNRKIGVMTELVAPDDKSTFQHEQTEYIYNDVRESQMIDNVRNDLPRNNASCNIQTNHCRSLPRGNYYEHRNQLTRSKTLDPGHYGRYNETSDSYNYLHFQKISISPEKPRVSTCLNDYDITKPTSDNGPTRNVNIDTQMSLNDHNDTDFTPEECPAVQSSGTLKSVDCRPYSSVNYNRNADME